ncbi:MAG: hypothetical protein Q7T16_01030 [Candidatus Burarchaeum sp.]|nr:hypothetical protein [Candidatus Burarchaeum sp.]MDO8339219.1 hypothetical protein [Candidatus Burarchaeum sp.]
MRGQSAFEYVVIVSIALLILFPIWVHVNNAVNDNRMELQRAYALNAVSRLKSAADAVYVQGEPAKFTVIVSFPPGVDSVTISNHEISIRMGNAAGTADAIATTLGPVSGTIFTGPGAHRITVMMNGTKVLLKEGA